VALSNLFGSVSCDQVQTSLNLPPARFILTHIRCIDLPARPFSGLLRKLVQKAGQAQWARSCHSIWQYCRDAALRLHDLQREARMCQDHSLDSGSNARNEPLRLSGPLRGPQLPSTSQLTRKRFIRILQVCSRAAWLSWWRTCPSDGLTESAGKRNRKIAKGQFNHNHSLQRRRRCPFQSVPVAHRRVSWLYW